MANVGTFDFNEVTLIIGGFTISGFADADDAIMYSRRNDMFDLISGADGQSVFVKKTDKSGQITAKLLPSSASNDILSSIALAAENLAPIPVPVLIQDGNGTTLVASAAALVMKIPDGSLGKNLGSNDWVLLCADMDVFVGGMS